MPRRAMAGLFLEDEVMEFYRIVETDNYGGDYPNEKFAMPYALRKEEAEEIAAVINKHLCHNRYWKVVKSGYELQPGFEP